MYQFAVYIGEFDGDQKRGSVANELVIYIENIDITMPYALYTRD